MEDIVELTFDEFEYGNKGPIWNQTTKRFEPLGLFLVLEDDNTWSAIDNSSGCVHVEGFSTKDRAVNFLRNNPWKIKS